MLDLSSCRLYGILDLGYVSRDRILAVAGEMVNDGVDLLQLRAKAFPPEEIAPMTREVLEVTRAARIPLIVNDHPRIAAETGADGVHVGQDDESLDAVRAVLGQDRIIGKSTHSLDQAVAAAREGADYIGFGPLFATPTKPDYRPIGLEDIAAVHERVEVPIFCIGGIKRENLETVISAGARRVVIVSGILESPDRASYMAECRALLTG